MNKYILLIIITSFLIFIYKKKNEKVNNFKKEFCIICTTSIIKDAIKQIVGNLVKVESLMGPGIDPHLYKAKSGDVYLIEQADLIFYNGLHLEGKMVEILENLNNRSKKSYAVSNCLNKNDLRKTEYENIYDPHIWFNVLIWKKVILYISECIKKELPSFNDEIEKNTNEYLNKLNELDLFVRENINKIPIKNRVLITAHDAFGYFGKEYNIQVEGLQGISTDAEVKIEDIERVANIIINNNIKTIFVEQTIPEKYLKGVQDLIHGHGKNINIGKKLYSDALGEEEASNYIDMVKCNVLNITEGLL